MSRSRWHRKLKGQKQIQARLRSLQADDPYKALRRLVHELTEGVDIAADNLDQQVKLFREKCDERAQPT